jgi:hypothetical protein
MQTTDCGANLRTCDSVPNMRRPGSCILLALAASALAAVPAVAQPISLPPKPYTPVAIALPAASDDASFATFRAGLAAVAKRRVYAELAQLVQAQRFFWDRDFGHGFDPRKPGVDNLAAAIQLEHRNGSGWELLAAMATEATIEPLDSRPGVVCAPARPAYDGVALTRLLDKTYTGAIDWAYPRAADTPIRAIPQPEAAAIGTLGLNFVRLLSFEGPDREPSPGRTQWARVAAPDGRVGFVAPDSLLSLTTERICYIKDLIGGWRIAGYIAGGN